MMRLHRLVTLFLESPNGSLMTKSVSKKGTGTGQELVFHKVFTSIGRSQSPF